MPLENAIPRIDDRNYDSLITEVRTRIARYTPEWTAGLDRRQRQRSGHHPSAGLCLDDGDARLPDEPGAGTELH